MLIACATLLLVGSLFGAEPHWQQTLQQAKEAERSSNLPLAELLYEDVVKSNPNAEVYQRLGLVRHLQNKFEKADAAFENALRMNPQLWPSHLFAGIDLYRTNHFTQALEHLQNAERLQPNQKETHYWLGATLIALHHEFDGLVFLEKVLEQDSNNTDALSLLARAYADYGTKLLNDVANRFPDSPAGLLVEGQALEFEGSYGAALDSYLKARDKDPANQEIEAAVKRLQTHQ